MTRSEKAKLGWIKRRDNGFGSPTVSTRQRMSLALMGNTHGFKKGQDSWNKGKKLGPSWNKGKKCPQTTGSKNGMWKGGIDSKTLRKWALERDNYTCQNCGYRDLEIMEVDHIKEKSAYPELKSDLDNLQTLCPNCHAKKTRQLLRQKRTQLTN